MLRATLLIPFLLLAACKTSSQVAVPDAVRSPSEIVAASAATDWVEADPEYTLYLDIPDGRVVVMLSKTLALNHVAQIKQLAREGYFEGTDFYRVVDGFVAQGGDASGEKDIGNTADSLLAEFETPWDDGRPFTQLGNADGYSGQAGFINGFPVGASTTMSSVWIAHCTGALAFARGGSPNSASATIYITLQPQRYLDRNLTVVGRVIWGMEHVQSIARGRPGNGGTIADNSRWTPINSMKVAAELRPGDRLDLEYLDTNSEVFRELIESRRNRPEDFFVHRPDHLDLCQMVLPVREQTVSNTP